MTLNGAMTYRHRGSIKTLTSTTRINLLNELQQHGAKTVGDLAHTTGLHHNTAREHLHRLIEAGFVSSEAVERMQRFKTLLTTCSDDHLRLRKQIDMLDDHLEQCGFEAEIEPGSMHVTMHECPFSELAKNNPQVCQVHFTLVRDALQLTDGPLTAREIHPCPGDLECVIDLESDHTGE